MGFSSFVLTILALAVVLVFLGVKSVPQGFVWTVERFGKFTRELQPGLSFIIPVVDRIGRKINVMEQVLDIDSQEVITRDNAQVRVDGVVYVMVTNAGRAAYEVLNLDRAITNLTMTSIRSVLGERDLDQALSNRDEINNKLLKVIDEAARPWGTVIKRVEIKDISPPDDLVQSMARQMKAEREKRANVLEAEGFRAAAILKAEGERQAQILGAEAQKQEQILEAEGRKEAAFRDAAPHLVPPAERVEIDHNCVTLPGYLRLPLHGKRPCACVILVPGLDSTKEDFITLSEMCARRGLASFAFDGPGQGEVHDHEKLAEGYEDSVLTVFAAIAARPEIDSDRIGILGRSLGGYYIPRAAALEPRIKALAVFGGAFDLKDWDTMPKTILDGFLWATGSASMGDARARMGPASLADCIDKVVCPTLIVHGKRDGIFHYTQAERIAEAIGERAELVIEENGVHCCHNYGFRYRTMMIDWMARTL